MKNRLNIILFGATGLTGKFTIPKLHKLAKPFTWGVAGRSQKKLQELLNNSGKHIGVDDLSSVPIIIADVNDEESIKKMTASAKVIVNCCGPFELYGEVVIKSCIETGTHYVDVSGESAFNERMKLQYSKAAEEKGVYIVSACGVQIIPADLGLAFLDDHFEGTLNTVEVYIHDYNDAEASSNAKRHYGTWESIICFLKNLKGFFALHKTLKPLPTVGPKLPLRFPVRKTDLPGKGSKWLYQLASMDCDLIAPSQRYFHEQDGKVPPQMQASLLANSFMTILMIVFAFLTVPLLAQFKYGVNLLLKYPKFFSFGYFSTEERSEEQLNHTHFSCTFHGKGWSDKLTKDNQHYNQLPDKEIMGVVSVVNPEYGFTSVAVTLCAITILTQRKNLPPKGGVYSPAAAFAKTSLIQELQKNGAIFEILSVKDLV